MRKFTVLLILALTGCGRSEPEWCGLHEGNWVDVEFPHDGTPISVYSCPEAEKDGKKPKPAFEKIIRINNSYLELEVPGMKSFTNLPLSQVIFVHHWAKEDVELEPID
jgi:hypothetical protein